MPYFLLCKQSRTPNQNASSCNLYLVQLLLLLEGADLLPDLLDLLRASALDDVVSSSVLVSSNEIWVVDAGQGNMLLHVRHQLPLQLPVQYLFTEACICVETLW